MYTKDLVRVSNGEASITGLPQIRWTAVSGGTERTVQGQPVFDPNKNQKVRLPDEPEFEDLTLQTAYSTQYAKAFDVWYQKNKNATNLVVVCTIAGARYTFTGCAIASRQDFPGFDKNGQATQTANLSVVLSVGGRSPLQ
jgi:hypothetical protein